MKHVDSFLLQKPRDHIEFRKHALNIIDWGKDKCLNKIRDSLNSLLEESRQTASQLAKSRLPPSSDDSARSSSQKRKDSLSRGRNSRAKSVQEYPSGGANAPPSASFQEYNQDEYLVQIAAADSVYALPSASFQESNQFDSSVQIPAVDNVYDPPSASFEEYNQYETFVQIPAANSVYASPYSIFPANNENDPFIQASTANNASNNSAAIVRRYIAST
jgi:hypothetical protein